MQYLWFALRRSAVPALLLAAAISLAAQVKLVPPLFPAPSASTGTAVEETSNLWFVELASPPASEGTPVAAIRNEQQNFRAAARAAGASFTERYAFATLWNGLSLHVDRAGLAKISRIEGVANIYPVEALQVPSVLAAGSPDLATALAMTGADIVQNELGFTGRGVKVGIIDTGIDIDHPAFGGSGVNGTTPFPSARVIAGYDFVGDAYDASANPVPVPDNNPDDCAGHGTHVAGIVAANGAVKGAAPDAALGAYRVFGCSGTTSADVMIAAMERALADGMQIVNMSIGSAYQWPQYPTAAAATRLVNKGVVVVASMGNSGANGLYAGGAPGLGGKVISVASYDNTHLDLRFFRISPDDRPVGYNAATGAPAPPLSGTSALARTGTSTATADACSALPAGSLSGKIALIRRGTCTFYLKASNAQNAGAAGVVLYNNTAGFLTPTVAGTPAITIPVVAITAADGVVMDSRIASGPVSLTWTGATASFPNANGTGNLISSFSSYGLAPDLSIKPDLGAPGGYIHSTYPLELGGYANLNGTSMSSPHVAGAAALLLQARPHTPSQAMAGLLQNSAAPKPWWGNPTLGLLDNVHRQGAGMLQIHRSILATSSVDPPELALGESQGGPATRTLTIRNDGTTAVTYNLGHLAALSTGPNTFAPAFYLSDAAVEYSQFAVPVTSVTVAAGGSASVDVKITVASAPAKGLYGGYLVVTPLSAGEAIQVPYAGFIGDYQSIQVLAPTTYNLPWLAKWASGSYIKQSDGATYTMAGADIPYFLVHLDHPSRRIVMEVTDARTGKAWHRFFSGQYLPRNSTATSFFAFVWDGQTTNGSKVYTVPSGDYYVTVSVLKALGDSGNPADWEKWTSPMIRVAR